MMEYRKINKYTNSKKGERKYKMVRIFWTKQVINNQISMAQYTERLARFEQERKEIHEKMKPLKDELKPLTMRLIQVWRNIWNIKTAIKQHEV